MVINDADQTFTQLELVLDRLATLRHLSFGSVSTELLYSVAGRLSGLETLRATAVCDRNTTEHL